MLWLYLWHDFYNIIFKIKPKLHTTLPPGANFQGTYIKSRQREQHLLVTSCGSLHLLLHMFISLNICLLFRVTNSAFSKLSLMKMKLFLRRERLWHKIINSHGCNPVAKHSTVMYEHKNKLSCEMAQVVAANLSPWRFQAGPVQSNPIHVGLKSTKWQQDKFYSEYYFFLSVSFYEYSILITSNYQLHNIMFKTGSTVT